MFTLDKSLRYKYCIVAAVFCALICVALIWYQWLLAGELRKVAIRDLSAFSHSTSVQVTERLEKEGGALAMAAAFISSYPSLQSEAVINSLALNARELGCQRLMVSTSDGLGVTTTGRVIDVKDRPFFKEAMAGRRLLSHKEHGIVGNDEISFTVPISRDGKAVGALTAFYTLREFQLLIFTPLYRENSFSYLTDMSGNIIFSPSYRQDGTYVEQANIFDYDRSKINDIEDGSPDFRSILLQGESGAYVYSFDGERRCLYYSRLGINNWYLISVIPLKELMSQYAGFTKLALLFGFVIIVLFSIMGGLSLKFMRDQMRRTQRAKDSLETLTSNIPGGVSRCCCDERLTSIEVSDGYLELLECDRERFVDVYKNELINTVCPEDREKIFQAIKGAVAHGTVMALEYRLVTPAGKYKWVLLRGRKIQNEDGTENYCSVIIDNTEAKAAADALALSEERYRVVVDNADEFIFDWNVVTDEVYFSPAYTGCFGERRIYQLAVPEDMDKYKDFIDGLVSGESGARHTQLRLSDSRGTMNWYRLDGTPIIDNGGKVLRIVGSLKNIAKQVEEREELEMKAKTDALTGLLSKGAAEEAISRYLASAPLDARQGLFICDIDNFKTINDTLGHLTGDSVLKETAQRLRASFRAGDIVGRAGGDEFIILMKGVKSIKDVRLKGHELTEELRHSVGSVPITLSVGAALWPSDGRTRTELFDKADKALYNAKNRGRDNFSLYLDIE